MCSGHYVNSCNVCVYWSCLFWFLWRPVIALTDILLWVFSYFYVKLWKQCLKNSTDHSAINWLLYKLITVPINHFANRSLCQLIPWQLITMLSNDYATVVPVTYNCTDRSLYQLSITVLSITVPLAYHWTSYLSLRHYLSLCQLLIAVLVTYHCASYLPLSQLLITVPVIYYHCASYLSLCQLITLLTDHRANWSAYWSIIVPIDYCWSVCQLIFISLLIDHCASWSLY